MAREKEYCVKAELNANYILFIGYIFGKYHVFVKSGEHTYSVYGGYKNIGTASARLKKSAQAYHSNHVSFWYTSKSILEKTGALFLPDHEEERRLDNVSA